MIDRGPTTRNRGASFPPGRPSARPNRTTVLARQGYAVPRHTSARPCRLCAVVPTTMDATGGSAGNEAHNEFWLKRARSGRS